MREARAAAAISHPLICQVYDLGEWDGRPYLVMELVQGDPLSARLGRPFPPDQALRWALAIGEGLAVLHHHAIVHRDMKPSNVFVTRSGLKLLDFGLARPIDAHDNETMAGVTQARVIVGTPQYAAPEQLSGDSVDARADLFSLGVMLFEMVTGRPPWSQRSRP